MISAIIPAYNEAESLSILVKRLILELQKVDKDYEIIFVDDGSTDTTLSILKQLRAKNKAIRIFSFRRNQGKAEALTVGFQMVKGEYIVTLDGDLQDRPEEIGKLVSKIKEGYDVVGGWRKNRKDSAAKKIASKLFNRLMGILWDVKLHDYNCGLKVYTKDAVKSLYLYGGMHRFIPLLLHEQGFEVTEISVDHDLRKFGKSKFGVSKLWKDIPDMFTLLFLTRYGKRPLHFFWIAGSVLSAIGVGIVTYFWIIHTFFGKPVEQRPLLYIGITGILVGLQIFFSGFLADLMTNLFHQSQVNKEEVMQKHLLKYSSDI